MSTTALVHVIDLDGNDAFLYIKDAGSPDMVTKMVDSFQERIGFIDKSASQVCQAWTQDYTSRHGFHFVPVEVPEEAVKADDYRKRVYYDDYLRSDREVYADYKFTLLTTTGSLWLGMLEKELR